METNPDMSGFLRRLIIAPPGEQSKVIEGALAVLDGAPPPDQILVTGAQAARMLAISIPTLFRMRQADKIRPVYVCKRPRFRVTDLKKIAQGDVK